MGAGVKNLGGFFVFQFFEKVQPLGALLGRKILEGKVVRGHTATDQCRYHGAGSRDRPHVNTFANAFPDQVEGWVRNSRGARVTDQGDVSLFFQVAHVFGSNGFFIEVVVGLHWGGNPEMVEEDSRVARIFGKYQRHFFQGTDRTVGDVLHVPDRSRYNIQGMSHGSNLVITTHAHVGVVGVVQLKGEPLDQLAVHILGGLVQKIASQFSEKIGLDCFFFLVFGLLD